MRLVSVAIISAYLTFSVGFDYQYNDDNDAPMNTTVTSLNVSVAVIVTEAVYEKGFVVNEDDDGEDTRSTAGVSVTTLILSLVAVVCFGFAIGSLLGSYVVSNSKKASRKGLGGRQRWPEIRVFVPPIREDKSVQTQPNITNVALSPRPVSFSSDFDMDGEHDVTDEFQELNYGTSDPNVTIADVHLRADDLVQKFTDMVVK